MKIQVFKPGSGGPGVFISRLCEYLTAHYDVKIVDSNPDIYFSVVWRGSPPKNCKVIHRADGAYFAYEQRSHFGYNKKIGTAINKAHAVVYQSRYSQKICQNLAGAKQKNKIIIYNGINPLDYNGIKIDKMGYEKMFVASALWRPLKRPRSIAKGFVKAQIPNSVLVMIGPIDKKHRIKHPDIKYVGKKSRREVFNYYKSADGVINISRLDACPNVVVEGLVAGVPIICNNVGGGPELVQDDGIILDIDPPFKYKKFHMKNPDKVHSRLVASGFTQIVEREWKIHRPDLFMDNTAKEYYNYFKKVLSC